MIYSFTLSEVATVLGLFYLFSHGWALWRPEAARNILLAAPRHTVLGTVLLAAATLWFAWVLSVVPLMEYEPQRSKFVIGCVLGGVMTGIYVREFLAVRALGALLLLVAELMLESAFLRSDPARLVITVTAYVYVIAGCFFVGSPYLARDGLKWLYAQPGRPAMAAGAGVAFGVLLLALGLFVY